MRGPEQSGRLPRAVEPVSLAKFRQLQADAESKSQAGNGVKAMLSHLRSMKLRSRRLRGRGGGAAKAELTRFTERLQNILGLSDDEFEQRRQALNPLLTPAADGFWSNEARILYDLQKVCMEEERGVYRLDLIGWIRKLGKQPIRRPLPLMQERSPSDYLRTVRRRIAVARLTPAEKSRLVELLEGVLPHRNTFPRQIAADHRRRVRQGRLRAGERAGNRLAGKAGGGTARPIVERNFLTMGDLRDAISKNNLKLADVTTVPELMFGDCLLRADKQFDTALDGVYRRGAIYRRWPQTLSSMFFGTNFGRQLTRHLFIPIGGAFLVIEFLHHRAGDRSWGIHIHRPRRRMARLRSFRPLHPKHRRWNRMSISAGACCCSDCGSGCCCIVRRFEHGPSRCSRTPGRCSGRW